MLAAYYTASLYPSYNATLHIFCYLAGDDSAEFFILTSIYTGVQDPEVELITLVNENDEEAPIVQKIKKDQAFGLEYLCSVVFCIFI